MDRSGCSGQQSPGRLTLVVVSGGVRLVEHLRSALDADVFTDEGPTDAALILLEKATPTALDGIRQAYPTAAVMAVLPVDAGEADMLALYRACADLVTEPESAELLVAHVRALLRRRAWSAGSPEAASSFPSVDRAETSG